MDIKKKLISAGKDIYGQSLIIGAGGNISARCKEKIFLKASGASLKSSKACDYVEIDMATGRQKSAACKPSSIELPMHIACYRARPDIGAVVHTHPIFGTTAASFLKRLGFISYEFVCAVGTEAPVVPFIKPGSKSLAEAVGSCIRSHNAVLLKNHGALTVGRDIEEATERSIALERACKIVVLSKICGRIEFIPKSAILDI